MHVVELKDLIYILSDLEAYRIGRGSIKRSNC